MSHPARDRHTSAPWCGVVGIPWALLSKNGTVPKSANPPRTPNRKFSRQPKRRPQPPGTSWEPLPDAEPTAEVQDGYRVGNPHPRGPGSRPQGPGREKVWTSCALRSLWKPCTAGGPK